MEEGYVDINHIPTRVITVGGWIDQPIKKRHLIIVIPGNPGLIGYYEEFVRSLHGELLGKYVIWGLGHAGHDVPKNVILPTINDKPELFTLDGQVNHKIKFIDTYVPTDVNLHFIGHSIGAKICVELVKRYRKTHNAAAYLLFPTLERMAQTPSGRKLWPILGPFRKVVVLAASLINRLPESWLTTIVQWAMRSKGSQLSIESSTSSAPGAPAIVHVNVRTTMSLLHPQALERSLFMAHDELKVVGELNAEDIRLHSDRLVLYFGTKDHWCPLEHYHNLQLQVPEARAIICPHGFEHAFVLQSSQQMATIVSEWIKEFS
ncbi:Lipid droplet-associated hydrolase [Daphnia magna]|uniref:Lipid droplet-associated hydrolase n=1 Tax=Daphnia magna TaxID=35525 RepID=A0A164QTQ7_9CRUS|nr:Lipid droplet-associated hydrolase [Daphnia magna]